MGGWGFIFDAIGRMKENDRVRGKTSARIKAKEKERSLSVMIKGNTRAFTTLTEDEKDKIRKRIIHRERNHRMIKLGILIFSILAGLIFLYVIRIILFPKNKGMFTQ